MENLKIMESGTHKRRYNMDCLEGMKFQNKFVILKRGATLKQFINDMINLTEGQKLVKYWWLWLSIAILAFVYLFIKSQFEKEE